ncbi:MAG: glycosyltransferase [Myxococcales bacterium]|nr:glycosyltransferase [Myxococcales bacterium]
MAKTLASADAMLHGSSAETYGLVVAEALCSGLPLIVPDIGGAADLAAPEYAAIYPAGSRAACQRAILDLLGRDREAARSAALKAAASKVGTMDDHFDALFSFYETLRGQRKRAL